MKSKFSVLVVFMIMAITPMVAFAQPPGPSATAWIEWEKCKDGTVVANTHGRGTTYGLDGAIDTCTDQIADSYAEIEDLTATGGPPVGHALWTVWHNDLPNAELDRDRAKVARDRVKVHLDDAEDHLFESDLKFIAWQIGGNMQDLMDSISEATNAIADIAAAKADMDECLDWLEAPNVHREMDVDVHPPINTERSNQGLPADFDWLGGHPGIKTTTIRNEVGI